MGFDSGIELAFWLPLGRAHASFWRVIAGLTPNQLTTCSLLCHVVSVVAVLWAASNPSAVLPVCTIAMSILLAYYFDVLDGTVARAYRMTSDFGAMYDVAVDATGVVLCSIVLFASNSAAWGFGWAARVAYVFVTLGVIASDLPDFSRAFPWFQGGYPGHAAVVQWFGPGNYAVYRAAIVLLARLLLTF